GDGRAMLLGEVIDRDGRRRDIQLKGAGRTPFSRMGDGKAPLGPVLREFIVSEAMAALGIPTTRSLAAVATGAQVYRETVHAGAVLTRVAASHIRVGTFQFFSARRDREALVLLADHVIARHYPGAGAAAEPYLALLEAVIAEQARLVAAWMGLGFIHGVMNTDNMTVSGETIDFGPCAFMEAYDPATVFSSIDQYGRYAYANQPGIAQWNLACFAQCLLPLLAEDEDAAIAKAQRAIDAYPEIYRAAWLGVMRAKLGLAEVEEEDGALAEGLLDAMAAGRADFTLSFRRLAEEGGEGARECFDEPAAFDDWLERWRARLARESRGAEAAAAAMRGANPLYIPRNHLVEQAIEAGEAGDFGPFEALLDVLARPCEERPELARYAAPARPEETVRATFCGT
ncbi:MAG: YdiU family protein, partial [Pseudomonadota bacterium]